MACVSPTLEVLVDDGALEIEGRSFGTDCNDQGEPGPTLGEPASAIDLAVEQGDSSFPLATV
ncbi:MAG TPA: hypothetical protein VEA78_13740, partial [Acidimicrobiales bacterium]|nr:hypothetical protein [Acidimicrobiales bacterium]